MTKDRDYEIVTALQIHLKAAPWKFEIEFCMLKGPQVQGYTQLSSQPNAISSPSYSCGRFYSAIIDQGF